MRSVLSIDGLTVRYGGLTAVDHVSFDVAEGQFVGVIGPNGAGKTTFIDAVSGLTRSLGRVEMLGHDISSLPPHGRTRLGLGRTFQSLELFEDLTVRENMLCAAEHGHWWSPIVDTIRPRPPGNVEERVSRAIEFLRLGAIAHALPPDLSLGQRKLVTIARALAGRPRVLLLDEPAAGLDSEESQALGVELRSLVEDGLTVVMVEHDMNLVLAVCDEIKVLEFGALIAQGPPDEVSNDPRVAEAYLGSVETTEA